MKAIMTFTFFFCCLQTAFGLLCPQCSQYMLDGDKFCPNCGWEKRVPPPEAPRHYIPPAEPKSNALPYHEYVKNQSSGNCVGERLAGIGRGMATAILSPLNLFRGAGTGVSWTESIGGGGTVGLYGVGLFISVGTAFGSFATCADAINGSLDMVSCGYYGDWLYERDDEKGHPTPWVWKRKWKANAIPWIGRE